MMNKVLFKQENDYKVSVIIPSYNRKDTIKRCIESILNQTKPVYEIIVVDDGSSDNTVEIIQCIKCDYLKLIKQNHRGAQAARNLGIVNANGNYIAFLDSDDEWLPNFLETQIAYLNKGNEDSILYSDCYVYDEIKKKKRIWKLPEAGKDRYKFFLIHQGPMFQSMIMKKEKLFAIGLLDEQVTAYQEWDTVIRLAKDNTFIHIKKTLFIYHLHKGETISKNKKKSIKGYNYIIRKYRKEIFNELGIEGIIFHRKNLFKLFTDFNC